MVKFYAKNDDEAYQYLKDYEKVANKKYKYYYESWSPYVVIGKNGKKHEYEDCFAAWDATEKSFFQKIIDFFVFGLAFWLFDRPRDAYHWIKDKIYLLKNNHKHCEYWSLDCHILDDIKWNIPLLNKHSHGMAYPYLNRAVIETHKDEKDFDINEWNKTNHEYTDEQEKLAVKYQEESRNELLHYVKMYEFYRDHGVTDDKEFDAKWHHTLPIKKGTFDSFKYDQLEALQKKYWNKIWEWMRVYGQTLWD